MTLPVRLSRRRSLRRAQAAVRAFPVVATRTSHGLDSTLVVSLTSYPPRFPTLANTIRSLLDQSVAPDRMTLWLAHEDWDRLPVEVERLQSHGLEILTCDDIGSYKKIIPLLDASRDQFIATCDDDVYYDPQWLATLVQGYGRLDPSIVCRRAHRPKRDAAGRMMPYQSWDWDVINHRISATDIFPTGVGGILYPPGCFADEVTDREAFMRLCPRGDDIWLYWMGRRAGSLYRQSGPRFRAIEWPTTQRTSLFSGNARNGNDIQIRAISEAYGPA